MTDDIFDPLYTLLVRGEDVPAVALTAAALENVRPSELNSTALTVREIVEQLIVCGEVRERYRDGAAVHYLFTPIALRHLNDRLGYRDHVDGEEGMAEVRTLVDTSPAWIEQRLLLDAFWPQAHELALRECPSVTNLVEAEAAMELALRSRPIRMHVDRSEVFQLQMNRNGWAVTWVHRSVRPRLIARILGHMESVVAHSRWMGEFRPSMLSKTGLAALARIGSGDSSHRAYPTLEESE